MSSPKPDAAGADAAPEEQEDDLVGTRIQSLGILKDADGLVALAKELRTGTPDVPRDMRGCLRAYEAAAELGHVVAAHAVGLFYLNGTVAARDEERAALAFRSAADAGHLASKVMLANFYELGIFYRRDTAKADVWYRNVARSAEIEDEVDGDAYVQKLADLGCVRYCERLIDKPETADAERARYQKLARAYGGGSASRASALPDMLDTPGATGATPEPASASAASAAAEKKPDPAAKASPAAEKKPEPATRASRPKVQVTAALGLTAFVYAMIFLTIGVVLGHVLDPFAKDHVAAGNALPVLGQNAEWVLPLCIGLLGALPGWLVYKTSAFVKAVVVAIVFGVAAEVLWGMGKTFLPTHVMQVTDCATAGLALGLLVIGVFGGANAGSK